MPRKKYASGTTFFRSSGATTFGALWANAESAIEHTNTAIKSFRTIQPPQNKDAHWNVHCGITAKFYTLHNPIVLSGPHRHACNAGQQAIIARARKACFGVLSIHSGRFGAHREDRG